VDRVHGSLDERRWCRSMVHHRPGAFTPSPASYPGPLIWIRRWLRIEEAGAAMATGDAAWVHGGGAARESPERRSSAPKLTMRSRGGRGDDDDYIFGGGGATRESPERCSSAPMLIMSSRGGRGDDDDSIFGGGGGWGGQSGAHIGGERAAALGVSGDGRGEWEELR
jgi:hypothetical protein